MLQLGFSLSPGGLMLPYHLGALECLEHEGYIGPSTDTLVAGSSAGAIASMAHGCGLEPKRVLEATVEVSDACHAMGGARGNLLPLLQDQMQDLIHDTEFEYLQSSRASTKSKSSKIGIAYTEIFPTQQSFLQTSFESRQDLFDSVSFSCMFPFFATNWPCIWDTSKGLLNSRLVVDGFFSVPRDRFGCPDFELASDQDLPRVDRTIGVAVFPKTEATLAAFDPTDCISPSIRPLGGSKLIEEDDEQVSFESLVRVATQATSRAELTKMYELGYRNCETWCRNEAKSRDQDERKARDFARRSS